MINVEALKNKVLDLAMHGKLVAQDSQDEPASALIEKIKKEKAQLIKDKKIKKTKALPPIEEDEIPYEIPDSWEWVRLGEVAKFREQIKPDHKFKYIDVRSIDNQHQKIDYTKVNEILPQDAPSRARKKIKKNDLIYSTVRPYLHNLAIFKENGDFIASTAFEVIKSTNNKFLKYQMLSSDFDARVNLNSTGSSYPAINHSNFIRMKIALPPLQEQQRIVDKIEGIFDELDKLNEASQKYDECKELLNKRVLDLAMHGKLVAQDSQDEPASALVKKIKEEKSQLIKDKKIKKTKALPPIEEDEIPYEIPDSWEWVRLGEIAEFKLGKTPAKKEAKYWNSADIPWVSISDLNNDIVSKTERSISKVASKEVFNENIVPKGSLLMSFKLTIGKMGILDMPAYHNEAIISFRLVNDMSNIFRNYLFISLPFFTSFVKTTPAVKGKTLNKKILTNMLIALPPQQEQRRIVDKVEEIFDTLKEI